jgi:hypothetical protein
VDEAGSHARKTGRGKDVNFLIVFRTKFCRYSYVSWACSINWTFNDFLRIWKYWKMFWLLQIPRKLTTTK